MTKDCIKTLLEIARNNWSVFSSDESRCADKMFSGDPRIDWSRRLQIARDGASKWKGYIAQLEAELIFLTQSEVERHYNGKRGSDSNIEIKHRTDDKSWRLCITGPCWFWKEWEYRIKQ